MNSVNKPVYPLIPPQEMIQFMLKYSFFHKQVTQIPDSIIVSQKIDFDVMTEAFNIEIERNDCLRLVFFKQNGKIMQYFRDPYRIGSVPIYNFKSDEEREKVLTADAQKPIKMLKGEIFRLKYFTTYDGRYGVYINIHHLVMDNAAVFAFFNDLFAVYDHLKNGKPMPKPLGSYEDRIKRELAYVEDKSNLEKEKAAYTEYITRNGEPLYLGVEGPKLLEAERKKKKDPSINAPSLFDPIHDKAELTKTTFSPELSEKFFAFCENNNVSPECLVQLALRMHLSKINNGHLDTYFICLCTRRRTLVEKRSGGTVTAPLPWRVHLEEDDTFMSALDKMADAQVWAFRHMDYPYLEYRDLQRELFNYSAAAGSSTMMFSWMPINEKSINGWEYEYVGYGLGRYIMVLYTFAMKDAHTGCLKISCLHRTKFVSVEDIKALQNGTKRALEIGLENPDISVKKLLEKM
ncbi:MAG TPA: condensation domain-containing protein [Oscillospiraceae bacterium]|nr:condensation domain-containing protein [Oscillospiraceae bacterium]